MSTLLTDTALDIDQFLNTDLFAHTHSSPQSISSSPSSPEHTLLTPPPSFHDPAADAFSLFDDDLKGIDSLNPSPFDYLGVGSSSLDHSMSGYPMDLGYGSLTGMAGLSMNMGLNMPIAPILEQEDALPQMAIDPQLVGTPASTAPISDFDDDEHDGDDEKSNPSVVTSPAASSPKGEDRERLTFTIAPIKVGGHGKARRGTVQSGGVVKKSSLQRDKENIIFSSSAHNAALATSSPSPSPSPATPQSSSAITPKGLPKPPTILKASASKKGKPIKDDVEDEDDDDVPQDWRPSPEVFAKMTSKEKRQLRNKISARNFRVRRKEYISTLEGDIAERDRLLDAIRSELGSTQSENLALRQEIASLKKVLLDGRGTADLPSLNLPPPAPLPVGGLAAPITTTTTPNTETMAPSPPTTPQPHQQTNATTSTANNPFAPNTQKDLPSSPLPRNGGAFWGGQHHQSLIGGLGGGITPVHTALVPEINVGLWGMSNKKSLVGDNREGMNINPLMNLIGSSERKKDEERTMITPALNGFEAFADANLFTMKSLDAYRMQLWGKMAAQHHAQQYIQQQQQQQAQQQNSAPGLTGHASGLRPAYFKASSSTGPLAALLSGKNASTTGLVTPPASPRMGAQQSSSLKSSIAAQKEKEREAQAAMLAVVASQTLFKKLGNAFWDAFSGSSSSPHPSTSTTTNRNWDAEKVRKVLEGKAVVTVVDVDPLPSPSTSSTSTSNTMMKGCGGETRKRCEDVKCCVGEILEESMRSLTLGKGNSGGVKKP